MYVQAPEQCKLTYQRKQQDGTQKKHRCGEKDNNGARNNKKIKQ